MGNTNIPHVLSYLAGLMDGEGYFGIVTGNKPNLKQQRVSPLVIPKVSVSIANKDFMLFLHKIIGYGFFRKKTNKHPHIHKDAWELTFTSQIAYRIAKELAPYLKLKKDQARLILDFYEKQPKPRIRFRRVSQEVLTFRLGLYRESLRLNHRGPN